MPALRWEQEVSAISRNKCGTRTPHAPASRVTTLFVICVRASIYTLSSLARASLFLSLVNSTLRRFLSQYRRLSVTRRARFMDPRCECALTGSTRVVYCGNLGQIAGVERRTGRRGGPSPGPTCLDWPLPLLPGSSVIRRRARPHHYSLVFCTFNAHCEK
jgi:hypothetical protein